MRLLEVINTRNMDKLQKLSNITTEKVNTKSITSFFETIKSVEVNTNLEVNEHIIKASELREDVVKSASEEEKALIMKNFPQQQGTYLVVPKVIQ